MVTAASDPPENPRVSSKIGFKTILPFLLIKKFGRNKIYPTEFDRNFKSHDLSLKKYRNAESKYLDGKAITFGPQGNIWNDSVVEALVKNDFKMMFSWRKTKQDLFTIPYRGYKYFKFA